MEAPSTRTGEPKAGPESDPAMPISRVWGTGWASRGPGSSGDRAVGVVPPNLSPWRRRRPSTKGEAPPFRGGEEVTRVTEAFDYRERIRFSAYATWWIAKAAQRYIYGSSRPIGLPVHQEEALAKISNVQDILFQRLGGFPSPEAVAEFLGGDRTAEAARGRLAFGQEVYSLNEPTDIFDNNGEFRFEDFAPAGGMGPEALAEAEDPHQRLFKILDSFPPKHRAVLRSHFGLETGAPLSLAEAGKHMGASRERAHQIEEEALRRLRSRPGVFALKGFLE